MAAKKKKSVARPLRAGRASPNSVIDAGGTQRRTTRGSPTTRKVRIVGLKRPVGSRISDHPRDAKDLQKRMSTGKPARFRNATPSSRTTAARALLMRSNFMRAARGGVFGTAPKAYKMTRTRAVALRQG